MSILRIAVIGGGPSGMMAAIQAAYNKAEVTLFERNERVLKKLLSTGNGKCNFSHSTIEATDYYGSFADNAELYFNQFGVKETLSFFENIGMLWKDKKGYLYPYSEQASTVLDALRFEADRAGVNVITEGFVKAISPIEHAGKQSYEVCFGDDKTMMFDKVIVACGGKAAPATGSDGNIFKIVRDLGIQVEKLLPALTKVICSDDFCKVLNGVRSDAVIGLYEGDNLIASDRGEIQFTEYGLSGIPVFQLSRIAAKCLDERKRNLTFRLDLFPGIDENEMKQSLRRKFSFAKELTGETFLNGYLNKKLSGELGKQAGIKYSSLISENDSEKIDKLISLSKSMVFHIVNIKGFEQSQVTAGGIKSSEVTEKLESKKMPGLYFVGEMLDMDGKCGGYNLQWAWTSGAIAGKAASTEA